MNLLNKLTIKNLKLNKKRTVVTIIGILLSVALLAAVSTMYASTIASLITFETTQKGNFHTAFYDIPVENLEDFKNNRKLESLYLTQGIGYASLKESQNEYKPYLYIKAFTKEAIENLSLKLIEGRLPQREEEVVIPSHLETNGRVKYKVGDTLTLEVGTRVAADGTVLTQADRFLPSDESSSEREETIQNTTTKTYKIVGVIERPANNIEDYSAPGYTLVTLLDDTKLEGKVDIYARYTKEGVKDYFKVTAGILGIDADLFQQYLTADFLNEEDTNRIYLELQKAKYRYMDNSYLVFLETNPFQNSAIGGLGTVVVIVLGIIVFTSVFCIKNSFDISITEKTKQYGMLRSIGATKKQIKKNVFYEATILGLIGIPLGLLSGVLASYILVFISNYFLQDMVTYENFLLFRFSWVALIVAVLLGIITIYFSAFRSARRASRISPIDSIRNSANIELKSKKLHTPKLIKKCFGVGGVISFKNQKRNKKKYRTTVISIVVSVFTFIALSSFMSLAFQELEQEISLSDYNISFAVASIDEETYAKVEAVGDFSNIKDYAITSSYYAEAKKPKYNPEYQKILQIEEDERNRRQVWIASLGEYQYEKYLKKLGLDPKQMKQKAILLDTTTFSIYDEESAKETRYRMRVFDYQAGDKISVFLDEKENSIEIGAVSEEVPFSMKENVNGNHSPYLIVSDEYMKELDLLHHVVVYIDSKDANRLQDELEVYFEDIENFSVDNQEENVRIMRNLFTLIGIFLYGFIIVISLIGITNIFNTITTNMELRKQEFAMLKSIGMTKKEFSHMIHLETIFIGCKALFVGIPIGVGLSYLIYRAIGNTEYAYHLPVQAILISIVAVFLLIAALMRYSMKKIQKQNTIETIRNENI